MAVNSFISVLGESDAAGTNPLEKELEELVELDVDGAPRRFASAFPLLVKFCITEQCC